ncbi:MAG TPA: hypothetical protein VLQ89_04985 [Candidatus Binatia bacterium]|nr:hypothetical protein [Candidatus Binatia bacterium]
MNQEQKKTDPLSSPPLPEPNEAILQEYTRSFWQNSKFWLGMVMFLAFLLFAFVYKKTVMDTSLKPQQLKASLEFFDISSQWVVDDKVMEADFKGIILVPEVSFRIRNIGASDLSYVFLLGVFRFMNNGRFIGEGYQMSLRKALSPGGTSERITLTAGFGYRASSAAAFEENKENWRNALCELFVKSHNSGLVSVKTFYISRKIAGQGIEVEIK